MVICERPSSPNPETGQREEIVDHEAELETRGVGACTGVFTAAAAYGQSPTALEQAELAGLSPELRSQVQARAVGGNLFTEVLQVMLLNNTKIKHLASQIDAMDWGRGVRWSMCRPAAWPSSISTLRRCRSTRARS